MGSVSSGGAWRRVVLGASSVVMVAVSAWGQDCGGTWATGLCQPGTGEGQTASAIDVVGTFDPDGPGPLAERLIVGGSYSRLGGIPMSGVAAWDGERWHAMAGTGGGQHVLSFTIFNGDLIAGGSFSTLGGVSANGIARWNGSAWEPLGSGLAGVVSALAVYNGELYAGGSFLKSGTKDVLRIARWDGAEWQPLGAGMTSSVNALIVYQGKLIAGGLFPDAGGKQVKKIAAWDGNEWSGLGSGIGINAISSDKVNDLLVRDGVLLVGGDFNIAGGIIASRLAVWNGSAWAAHSPAAFTGEIRSLATVNEDLFAVGTFPTIDGVTFDGTARWDGAAWHPMGPGLRGLSLVSVRDAVEFQGSLYACGSISPQVGPFWPWHLARWDGEAWRGVGQGFASVFGPVALASFEGDLYAGLGIASAGGTYTHSLSRWDGMRWWHEGQELLGGGVSEMAIHDGELIVGGDFTVSGGAPANRIARRSAGQWIPFGSGSSVGITAVRSWGGDLYAAGTFTSAGGSTIPRLARWDDSSWNALAGGLSFGTVHDLEEYGGLLIVAGNFQSADGIIVNNIARWNGISWSALGNGITGGSATVRALAVYNGDLIVAGAFTMAGGQPASNIARWDGFFWHPLGSGVGTGVNALAVYDEKLYVGGGLQTAGGQSVERIAAWDGENWSPLDGGGLQGITLTPSVQALAVHDGELIVAGNFVIAGGIPAGHWSRYSTGGGATIVEHPGDATVCPVQGAVFGVGATGQGTITYAWEVEEDSNPGVWTPLADGTNGALVISGSATAVLEVTPTGGAFTGVTGWSFRAKVTDGCGSVVSKPARLDVCYGDCECDGDLDLFDFLCFQGAYSNQHPEADCEGDGDFDIFDFLCFQGAFSDGCP